MRRKYITEKANDMNDIVRGGNLVSRLSSSSVLDGICYVTIVSCPKRGTMRNCA